MVKWRNNGITNWKNVMLPIRSLQTEIPSSSILVASVLPTVLARLCISAATLCMSHWRTCKIPPQPFPWHLLHRGCLGCQGQLNFVWFLQKAVTANAVLEINWPESATPLCHIKIRWKHYLAQIIGLSFFIQIISSLALCCFLILISIVNHYWPDDGTTEIQSKLT